MYLAFYTNTLKKQVSIGLFPLRYLPFVRTNKLVLNATQLSHRLSLRLHCWHLRLFFICFFIVKDEYQASSLEHQINA